MWATSQRARFTRPHPFHRAVSAAQDTGRWGPPGRYSALPIAIPSRLHSVPLRLHLPAKCQVAKMPSCQVPGAGEAIPPVMSADRCAVEGLQWGEAGLLWGRLTSVPTESSHCTIQGRPTIVLQTNCCVRLCLIFLV